MKHLVVTVHGIRTFGAWQERLEQLLTDKGSDRELTVINYKYGYLSIIAFIVPFTRWIIVRRFRNFLANRIESGKWDRIDLVGHSFGTHLIGWALHGLNDTIKPPVHVVLAGSVLKNNFPWDLLFGKSVQRIVNDCGVNDDVLFWNQLLVLGTGAAGRLGFNGGTGRTFRNRFFDFGHSDYFLIKGNPDDAFMKEYWVDIIVSNDDPKPLDVRQGSTLGGIKLTLLNNAEPIKLSLYTLLLLLPTWYVYGLYADAEAALARTFTERSWTVLEKKDPNRKLAAKYALAGWQLAPSNDPRYEAPLAYALSRPAPKTVEPTHSGAVVSLAATSDGSHAISTGDDGKAVLWSTHPFKRVHTFEHIGKEIIAASFNPDGLTASTVGSDGTVHIWDLESGSLEKTIQGRGSPSNETKALFGADGSYLYIETNPNLRGSTDSDPPPHTLGGPQSIPQGGEAISWRWSSENQTFETRWLLSTSGTTSVQAFNDDGSLIATAAPNGFVYLIGAESGELKKTFELGDVSTLGFSVDSRVLFAGTKDRRVWLWDIHSNGKPIELTEHEAPIRAISLSKGGKLAYVIDTKGNAYVWDTRTQDLLIARLSASGDTGFVKFDPKGRFAVIGNENGTTSLWDTKAVRTLGGLSSTTASAVHWIGVKDVLVGDRAGNIAVFNLDYATRMDTDLARHTCSEQSYKNATFSSVEVAADPLIREAWDPKQIDPKICECQWFFGCLRTLAGTFWRQVRHLTESSQAKPTH